ncbi:hypothetical protein STEG23_012821 [Scotinomys teguina]
MSKEPMKTGSQLMTFSSIHIVFKSSVISIGVRENIEDSFTQRSITEEWIWKMWYIYTMEYYTAEKNNGTMKFAGKWMELENVILSEGNTESDIGCQLLVEILRQLHIVKSWYSSPSSIPITQKLGLFMVSQISWTFCVMTFLDLLFTLTDESISSIVFFIFPSKASSSIFMRLFLRTQEHPDAITPQGPRSTQTPLQHKPPTGTQEHRTPLDQEDPGVTKRYWTKRTQKYPRHHWTRRSQKHP